jgi:hypothetical protein
VKRRYAWDAAYTALPESIRRRKTLDVEGLGPSQDGLGSGFILMNSGLSTVLIQAECDACDVPLSGNAFRALAQGEHC